MPPIRFGACLLDLDARQLLKDEQPVHLSPKAFELLRVLVTERPKAISKDQLHQRIWPGVFVTDDSLSKLVGEARAAIGDPPRMPRFLRTVHGFGYAFSSADEGMAASEQVARGVSCYVVVDKHAIVLAPGDSVIGRDPSARIVLDSTRVSRRHARLNVVGLVATLEDLGSRNGTSVNGQRLTSRISLRDGDEITIGSFKLRFRAATETAPTEADDPPPPR